MNSVSVIIAKETPKIRKVILEIMRDQREAAYILPRDELSRYFEGRQIDLLFAVRRGEKSHNVSAAFLRSSPLMHPAVIRAISYIHEHFRERVSLQSLATYAHLSKFRLCHLFKQQTGISAKSYLTFLRVRLAKELLEQERKSIAEVGQVVGFTDQSRFAKAFSQVEGVSPSTYRERVGHKPLLCMPQERVGGTEKSKNRQEKSKNRLDFLAAS